MNVFGVTREFFRWEDDLYEIVRKMKDTGKIEVINAWKDHLNADKVLRKGEELLFLKKIEEATIIN